jgi:hypothetical protein
MEEGLKKILEIRGPLGGGSVGEKTLGGGPVGEKALRENSVLIKELGEGLAVTEQRLGEKEMRNQMGSWDLHLESIE